MIKFDFPPNIEQLAEAFTHVRALFHNPPGHPDRPTGILFAYGEDIYNPTQVLIPGALMAHEFRHCARQFGGRAESWWASYIADPEFRYTEELLAHVEEYRVLASMTPDRNARAKLSMKIAGRLIAPLYEYQPPRSLRQAQRDLESLV